MSKVDSWSILGEDSGHAPTKVKHSQLVGLSDEDFCGPVAMYRSQKSKCVLVWRAYTEPPVDDRSNP